MKTTFGDCWRIAIGVDTHFLVALPFARPICKELKDLVQTDCLKSESSSFFAISKRSTWMDAVIVEDEGKSESLDGSSQIRSMKSAKAWAVLDSCGESLSNKDEREREREREREEKIRKMRS
ncbi:hypothetical protein ACLB2K_017189 [Fragaria x ananassa]